MTSTFPEQRPTQFFFLVFYLRSFSVLLSSFFGFGRWVLGRGGVRFSLFIREGRGGKYCLRGLLRRGTNVSSTALGTRLSYQRRLITVNGNASATVLSVLLDRATVRRSLLITRQRISIPLRQLRSISFYDRTLALNGVCQGNNVKTLLNGLFRQRNYLLRDLVRLVTCLRVLRQSAQAGRYLRLL